MSTLLAAYVTGALVTLCGMYAAGGLDAARWQVWVDRAIILLVWPLAVPVMTVREGLRRRRGTAAWEAYQASVAAKGEGEGER